MSVDAPSLATSKACKRNQPFYSPCAALWISGPPFVCKSMRLACPWKRHLLPQGTISLKPAMSLLVTTHDLTKGD